MWSNEIAEVELQVFKIIQSYYWQLMSLSIKSKNLNMNQWSGFQDLQKLAKKLFSRVKFNLDDLIHRLTPMHLESEIFS